MQGNRIYQHTSEGKVFRRASLTQMTIKCVQYLHVTRWGLNLSLWPYQTPMVLCVGCGEDTRCLCQTSLLPSPYVLQSLFTRVLRRPVKSLWRRVQGVSNTVCVTQRVWVCVCVCVVRRVSGCVWDACKVQYIRCCILMGRFCHVTPPLHG